MYCWLIILKAKYFHHISWGKSRLTVFRIICLCKRKEIRSNEIELLRFIDKCAVCIHFMIFPTFKKMTHCAAIEIYLWKIRKAKVLNQFWRYRQRIINTFLFSYKYIKTAWNKLSENVGKRVHRMTQKTAKGLFFREIL